MATSRTISLTQNTGWWCAYLAVLIPTVTYTVFRFGALYPADSLTTHPELSQQYKAFVGLSGTALAICLGIVAAAFGVWRASVGQGIAALAVGAGTTLAALSTVPLVRFPEDRYTPAALWVIGDGVPLLLAFSMASLAGWLITTAGARARSAPLAASR